MASKHGEIEMNARGGARYGKKGVKKESNNWGMQSSIASSSSSSLLDPKGKYGYSEERMRSLLDRRCMDGH